MQIDDTNFAPACPECGSSEAVKAYASTVAGTPRFHCKTCDKKRGKRKPFTAGVKREPVTVQCPNPLCFKSSKVVKDGSKRGKQYFRCKRCGRQFHDQSPFPGVRVSAKDLYEAIHELRYARNLSEAAVLISLRTAFTSDQKLKKPETYARWLRAADEHATEMAAYIATNAPKDTMPLGIIAFLGTVRELREKLDSSKSRTRFWLRRAVSQSPRKYYVDKLHRNSPEGENKKGNPNAGRR